MIERATMERGKMVWTPHPVLRVPTRAQALAMGEEWLLKVWEERERRIALEAADPFRYGYEPAVWGLADGEMSAVREKFPKGVIEELDLGGNRASKTERAAKRVVETLVNTPGARVWCGQATQASSIQSQQSLVWKYLPAEWKPTGTGKMRQGVTTKIVYSQAGGFTEDTFVLPNGSQCWFKYYSMDVKNLEGAELDRAWMDELVTPEWLEAVRFRLVTRNGVLHTTFTPLEGYSATVKEYLQGVRTLMEVDAELLPRRDAEHRVIGYETVPRVQLPMKANARIFYFHTADNPYGNYESMKLTLADASREKILVRAYGVPTRAMGNVFPKFRAGVHVLPPERIPKVGTRYHFVDPCSPRNWFMHWYLVDPRGRLFIYREWPCPSQYIEGVGFPGNWAEPDGKRMDGKAGEAQKPFGFGLKRYAEEIFKLEGRGTESEERIFERFMDSRYGNTVTTVSKEQPTTLIEACEESDVGLMFLPTPGDNIDEGVGLINDALDYDLEQPLSERNEPRLYLSSACENTIFALQEWTGKDGNKGACKDPIDLIRYALGADLQDVPEGSLKPQRRQGGY